MNANQIETLRTFKLSAEARSAGYSTIAWLRAFSFAEHAARIDASRALAEREYQTWEVAR